MDKSRDKEVYDFVAREILINGFSPLPSEIETFVPNLKYGSSRRIVERLALSGYLEFGVQGDFRTIHTTGKVPA